MEKSITAGLEEYIRTIPGMKEIDAKQCSPLVLAYVGDCVYDLIIKTMVVGRETGRFTVFMKRQASMCRHQHSPL